MNHKYKSETYYGVIIGGEKFQGWVCIYAGYPTLEFQHLDGRTLSFTVERLGTWMEECWDKFTTMAVAEVSDSSPVGAKEQS